MIRFTFRPEGYRYLIAQRGDLSAASNHDIDRLHQLWSDEIEKTIGQIHGGVEHVLDLGSGLSLLGLELNRRYGTFCTLVDSEAPPPLLNRKHNIPFCDRRVVEQFWADNGNTAYRYLSPDQFQNEPLHASFDLVISSRSWCFHYPPSVYLLRVLDYLCEGGVVLVDVRKHRDDWFRELALAFPGSRNQVCVEQAEKFVRMRYVRGSSNG